MPSESRLRGWQRNANAGRLFAGLSMPYRFKAISSHDVFWSLPATSDGRKSTGDTPVAPRALDLPY